MDGYGLYVWLSYAVTALVLAGLTLTSWLGLRRSAARLDRVEARREARHG